jgi:LuxR family maltose regulon positive regulatory protein
MLSTEPHPDALKPGPALRLLRTKFFVPRGQLVLVPRARLLRRLDDAAAFRLIVVVAPAGSGKTTLLAEWVTRADKEDRSPSLPTRRPVAWLSLDASDNDPARFWSYFVAALETVWGPGLGAEMLALLGAPQPPPLEAVLASLINDIATRPAGCLLVLDDYHSIENPDIHRGLDFLLVNLPPALQMVIASRYDPPLALARLRARRQLLELTAADLCFTTDETAAFLNQVMRLDLTGEQVAALEARTEGWAAGLQLAALSMQGARTNRDVARIVRAFGGNQRYVFDYLAQEVLAHQPVEVQAFLLRTSIYERMTAESCDAVMAEEGVLTSAEPPRLAGAAMLDRLERANLFLLPLDADHRWYRYHHLFAEFLRAQLEREEGPENVRALHQRACRWYERHNLIEDALHHALAAGEHDAAARLIESVEPEMFRRGALLTLGAWLRALPGPLLAGRPRLNTCFAWVLLAIGQFGETERKLAELEAGFGARAEDLGEPGTKTLSPLVRSGLAEVAAIRANLAFHHLDTVQALALSRRALAYVNAAEGAYLYHAPAELRVPIYFTMALALEYSGETAAASAVFAQAIDLARTNRNVYVEVLALSHLGQLQAQAGRLHEAFGTYRLSLSIDLELTGRPTPLIGVAHAGLGWILYEWNDLDAAAEEFRTAIELGRQWRNWEALTPGHVGLALTRAARNDPSGAAAVLSDLETFGRKHELPMIARTLAAVRARWQADCGQAAPAAAWVASCGLAAMDEIPYALEGEALILARVLITLGRSGEASLLLDHLLTSLEAGARTGRAVEALVLLAWAADAAGDRRAAHAHLRRALDLAQAGDYIRTFLDAGQVIHALLAEQAAMDAAVPAARLMVHLRDQGRHGEAAAEPPATVTGNPRPHLPAQPVAAALAEPLSPRELEVLRLLANGLSNAEIAGRLVVSLNTVKTHLKAIYAKLEAGTRTQALARARELHLL